MDLRLIDGIGPFFRPVTRRRLNWSKIPFHDLKEDENTWQQIRRDLDELAKNAIAAGFNAITLDDISHLTPHPYYEEAIQKRISFFNERFRILITDLQNRGLRIFITSDVLTLSPAVVERLGQDRRAQRNFYLEIIQRFFAHFPQVEGIILRIGESDGLDVHDQLRSQLHLRSAREANEFLQELLPRMKDLGKKTILRTWTVGAHRLGDLIWHRGTLEKLLEGIDCENFILSMKPGDSDFFRYLPLNQAFFRYSGRKILELQARPEYEGAGELPSFLGLQYTRYLQAMEGVENLCGISVWCQTGGWHRFRRYSFFATGSPWIELNAKCALALFARNESLDTALNRLQLTEAKPFLEGLDRLMREVYYIRPFAEQKFFFRRVRIPPLLHIYWDTLFCIAPVRKLMRFFVPDHDAALQEGEDAMALLPELLKEVKHLPFPEEDIHFFADTLHLIALTRRYFFTRYDSKLVDEIIAQKKAYKTKWPKSKRARFRIRTDFTPFHLKRRTLLWSSAILFRKKRGYRFLDYAFVLTLLGFFYRAFSRAKLKALPKFVRKSAMGVDSLFK